MDPVLRGFFIFVCLLFGGMFASISFDAYQRRQCQIVAIQAKMPAGEIEKVCSR